MKVRVDWRGSSGVAIIDSDEVLIEDVQGALDLLATVQYNEGVNKLLLRKENVSEAFFDLSTRLAGEVLQKYVNYQVKLAIVGNYDGYSSKSLKDFIYESNKGSQVFFLPSEEAALEALHTAG
ncbi:DUF4180 domain-containing protein [Cohnella thailandensis]|uniref:DUF4180 domain-containing protein n=1 Tax=Cohnella thailandensis TaxID=557557 RepID=A0A841SU42_9BACL|nr:DUF4180 domain-containing protein [Cohnella thailandensis]MBP1972391.1 hypothetical protein [Cohnella thailandensis]